MADLKRYESTFIIGGNVADEDVEKIITKAEDTVGKNGGQMVETERWGRRKLAYNVEENTSGHYISLHFTAPGAAIARLERMYQLDEQVLRWLTLVMPEKNIQRRAAMKKRLDDVQARRERELAAQAEAEATERAAVDKERAAANSVVRAANREAEAVEG